MLSVSQLRLSGANHTAKSVMEVVTGFMAVGIVYGLVSYGWLCGRLLKIGQVSLA